MDAVVTSLPGPAEVRAVVEGPGGILAGVRAGSVWVDMSTTDRHQTERLAARLAEKSVASIEAGTTGGVDAAWDGHVVIFVGAADEDFARWRPVLDALADQVFHMGPLGAGMVTKLISNMMCFAQQSAFAEGLAIGTMAGLDPARLIDAISASYAGSFITKADGPKILDGSYDPSFAIGLVAKDARLGLAMARELGAPLRVFPVMQEIVKEACVAYGEGAGNLVTARLYEDAAGVVFRPRGRGDTT